MKLHRLVSPALVLAIASSLLSGSVVAGSVAPRIRLPVLAASTSGVQDNAVRDAELARLREELKSPNRNNRSNAASQLSRLKLSGPRPRELAEALEAMLEDKDPGLRADGAKALGVWGTKESVDPLIKLLKDTNDWVRVAAVQALGSLKDERGVRPIAERLADPPVTGAAREALKEMGPIAERAVWDYLTHRERTVQEAACDVLKKNRHTR